MADLVRDVAGQELAVGDRVVTNIPGYCYTLGLGVLLGFTPKGARVLLDDPQHHSGAKDKAVQRFLRQIAKVPRA